MTDYHVTEGGSSYPTNGGTNNTTDAWASIRDAVGNLTAYQDRLLVYDHTTRYTESTVINGNLAGIEIIAVNSSGVEDGTVVEIDASNLAAGVHLFDATTTANFLHTWFRGFKFVGSVNGGGTTQNGSCFYINGQPYIRWTRCQFDGFAGTAFARGCGIMHSGGTESQYAEHCLFTDNETGAFGNDSAGRGGLNAYRCIFDGNGSHVFLGVNRSHLYECLFAAATRYDILWGSPNGTSDPTTFPGDNDLNETIVQNCTFINTGDDSIWLPNVVARDKFRVSFINNIWKDVTNNIFNDVGARGTAFLKEFKHNCYHGQTALGITLPTDAGRVHDNITTDPSLVDIVGPVYDVSLQAGSPCIGAGYPRGSNFANYFGYGVDYPDIGCRQYEPAGGGGAVGAPGFGGLGVR